MKYFLGLGSNVGTRNYYLQQAARLLIAHHIRIIRTSSVYETEPVDYPQQPWFLNCVLQIETELNPEELLSITQSIEKQLGRQRRFSKGPRTIDIDILLAENLILATNRLIIPHPRLVDRNFVLIPLAEIAPGEVHPVNRKKISILCQESQDKSKVIKLMPFIF
jgi:2-amino-4-hydroxy-6-hydroxymethyldihydropteridine diphosphokinase